MRIIRKQSQMSSISNISAACRNFVDQMNRSRHGWHDGVQKNYYDHRLNPLIDTAVEYQSAVYEYMRLLEDYDHQIASLAGTTPIGTGIGEHELFRQHIDPQILEQIFSKQR